jgi:hypothetical protein
MFLGRIRELEAEHKFLLEQRREMLDLAARMSDVEDLEDAVSSLARRFLTSFKELPLYEKRELVRRCVSRIIVDHPNLVVKCYIRKIPLASDDLVRLLQQGTKSKTAPGGDQMPFRKAEVAGTGLEPATFGL